MLGGCPTGEARITKGYRLPARHVIHTVGPVWRGGVRGEHALLSSAYRSSLELALQHSLSTIAFPAISTGVYGFPPSQAADVAIGTVLEVSKANPQAFSDVVFCCFSEASAAHHQAALAKLVT
jgi:O-acetyl-ADP-ribose deacetylase (regulator of RNase III)